MSPDDEQPLQFTEDAGDIEIGVDHGPPRPPVRRVKFRSPDGTVAEQVVSEEAWQKLEVLKRKGMSFLATTSRKEIRAQRAEQKRARRRADRARARQKR